MSAVAGEAQLAGVASPGAAKPPGLSRPAKFYFALVATVTLGVVVSPLARLDAGTRGWPTFLVLAACAAAAQLVGGVTTTRNQSYNTSSVFLVAGAILLPPPLLVLLGLVQHLPEWLKMRYAWYIQTFNICNFTLDVLAASATFKLAAGNSSLAAVGHARWAGAALAACLVFVALNHSLLATMLYLGRGHYPRETGLFSAESLATDLVLAALGIAISAFWQLNPWLILFGVAPLALIHRSLHVPQLQEQARVDPKTGLFNARHFFAALTEELSRAQRFDRPLALIMADLDLLRDINNTYGHLAGDAVLGGIADVFRSELRHYDLPARFGGEEFALLLPETTPEEAHEIADRIRRAVAVREFEIETSSEPIRATISMGVAAYPRDAKDQNELVHRADLAVYRAKLQGRNRVLFASPEPLSERPDRRNPLVAVAATTEVVRAAARRADARRPVGVERRQPFPTTTRGPRFLDLPSPLAALVLAVAAAGVTGGALGVVYGGTTHLAGLLAVVGLVGIGQILALEVKHGSISVVSVGAITGAALFGARAALLLAAIQAIIEWIARRAPLRRFVFNISMLTLAFLAAAGVFAAAQASTLGDTGLVLGGIVAGLAYFVVDSGLLSLALAFEGRQRAAAVWTERFAWLAGHYLGYGLLGGVVALAYHAVGLYALLVAAVPLLLMRRTQADCLAHTQRSAEQLREAAETIQSQNVSLERAKKLLRERSTAMDGLSASVDARGPHAARLASSASRTRCS